MKETRGEGRGEGEEGREWEEEVDSRSKEDEERSEDDRSSKLVGWDARMLVDGAGIDFGAAEEGRKRVEVDERREGREVDEVEVRVLLLLLDRNVVHERFLHYRFCWEECIRSTVGCSSPRDICETC